MQLKLNIFICWFCSSNPNVWWVGETRAVNQLTALTFNWCTTSSKTFIWRSMKFKFRSTKNAVLWPSVLDDSFLYRNSWQNCLYKICIKHCTNCILHYPFHIDCVPVRVWFFGSSYHNIIGNIIFQQYKITDEHRTTVEMMAFGWISWIDSMATNSLQLNWFSTNVTNKPFSFEFIPSKYQVSFKCKYYYDVSLVTFRARDIFHMMKLSRTKKNLFLHISTHQAIFWNKERREKKTRLNAAVLFL